MTWLLPAIRCGPSLVNTCKLCMASDTSLLGMVLQRTSSSLLVTVSMVTHSIPHLESSCSLTLISRYHRAAKFTRSMREIRSTSTTPPSTISRASSIRPPRKRHTPRDTSGVWSQMSIGLCYTVAFSDIQMTRRASQGSSGCFTRHSLWLS